MLYHLVELYSQKTLCGSSGSRDRSLIRSLIKDSYQSGSGNLSLDPLYLYFNYNEATGIEQVGDRSNSSGLRYNLLGQPAKGEALVIRNGQVVFER